MIGGVSSRLINIQRVHRSYFQKVHKHSRPNMLSLCENTKTNSRFEAVLPMSLRIHLLGPYAVSTNKVLLTFRMISFSKSYDPKIVLEVERDSS